MRKALIALALTLCSSAAFANHTMPSAGYCTNVTNKGNGQRSIHNQCAYPIQVEIRDPQGDNEMMFVNGHSANSTGTGGNDPIHTYACPTPSYPSQISTGPDAVTWATDTYYCVANN